MTAVYRYVGPSEHCYCHFRPATDGPLTDIPAMQDLGSRFAILNERMTVAALSVSFMPERRQAALWEILWSLTDAGAYGEREEATVRHPAVEMALGIIERGLAERLSVAELAERVGVWFQLPLQTFPAMHGRQRGGLHSPPAVGARGAPPDLLDAAPSSPSLRPWECPTSNDSTA